MLLTAVTYVGALFLFYRIFVSRSDQEAFGYVLATPLLTIPLLHFGNSASGGIFAFDIAIVIYALIFLPRVATNLNVTLKIVPGLEAMLVIAGMAFVSALINWALIESDPWRFYFFCMFRYLQFAFVAVVVSTIRIRTGLLRALFKPLAIGLLLYGAAMLLHLRGLVDLGGAKTFFAGVETGPDVESAAQSWFFGTFKASYAGNASIGIFFLLAILPFVRARFRLPIAAACTLLAVNVYLSTSRSDLIGLILGLCCTGSSLVLGVPRWRNTAVIAMVSTILVGGAVGYLVWQRWDERSRERITEIWNSDLRATGSYADRAHDQAALTTYMSGLPLEFFLGAGPGNYGRYNRMNVLIIGLPHSSYRGMVGELGIIGFVAMLYWCFTIARKCEFLPRGDTNTRFLSAIALGLLLDRMLSAWSAGGLFDSFNMTQCDYFALACLYLIFRLMRYTRRGQGSEREGFGWTEKTQTVASFKA